MLFIKNLSSQLIVISLALFMAACASNSSKKTAAHEVQEAKPYNFKKMQRRPQPKEVFGDNPYLQNPVIVSPAALSEYQFSVKALQGGNQDLGELQLKNMLEEYPELSGPAYNLAVLSKQRGNLEESLEYLAIATERNALNFDARNLYGSIKREQGEFEEAENTYLDILTTWGAYAPAHRNLGILYDLYLGQPEKAVVYYRQYNALLDEPDLKVSGWIVDIERRYGLKASLSHEEYEEMASQMDDEDESDDVDDSDEFSDLEPVEEAQDD